MMMMMMKKGRDILIVNKCQFWVNKRVGQIRYWSCTDKKTNGCQATARTEGDISITSKPVECHNYPDKSVEIERKIFKNDFQNEVILFSSQRCIIPF